MRAQTLKEGKKKRKRKKRPERTESRRASTRERKGDSRITDSDVRTGASASRLMRSSA
jgi:hypothetical protein